MKIYLMCGMPFSGKTTLAKSIARYSNCFYLSLDEINSARGLNGGDGIPIAEWEQTHFLAMQQLEAKMRDGEDIVLDDTNCFRWLRDRFRDLGAKYEYRTVIIFLNLPLSTIWQRLIINQKTKTRHQVKSKIVEEMVQTFEPPQADETAIEYTLQEPVEQWLKQHFTNNQSRTR